MAWKKLTMITIWGLIIFAWLGLFAFRATGPDLQTWTLTVTGVAILTEVGFWSTAAIMGVSLWESRKRVFGWLAKPFRRGR